MASLLCAVLLLAVRPAAPDVSRAPAARTERFVLELVDPATGEARAAGSATWRRRPAEGGVVQLELELEFRDGPDPEKATRVAHVEQLTPSSVRLVWRQWGGGPGRCLVAEMPAGGRELRITEWSRDEVARETLAVGSGALLPLELAERAREGLPLPQVVLRFDPLSRSVEDLEVRSGAGTESGGTTRTVELRRRDGTTAGRFAFRGRELESFQWQAGPLRARRAAAEDRPAPSRDP